MNSRMPLVSVIIPTYNSSQFVAQAVSSVLDQTYHRYEIIVVDDGSTDKTRTVLEQFRDKIKYVCQENRGPSSARNAGIKVARGEYVAFLDSDDLWTPNKLEVQVAFLGCHPHIGLVFSDIERFGQGKAVRQSLAEEVFGPTILSEIPVRKAFAKLVQVNYIPTPTVMMRKECFKTVGLFDENLRCVEDRDMWLRIAAYFDVAYIPSVLCKRRLHSSNISKDNEVAFYSRFEVLKRSYNHFPEKAPAELWDKELAQLYFQLACKLLLKKRRLDARRAAFQSLRHVATIRAIGLVCATFLGWPIVERLRRMKRSSGPAFFQASPKHG